MTESILDTIKQMLGIITGELAFDQEIMVHINSAFMELNQLGVGPEVVFTIQDNLAIWTDFLLDPSLYPAAKSFIYLYVKEIFDPPVTTSHLDSIQKVRQEMAWRLTIQVPTETV